MTELQAQDVDGAASIIDGAVPIGEVPSFRFLHAIRAAKALLAAGWQPPMPDWEKELDEACEDTSKTYSHREMQDTFRYARETYAAQTDEVKLRAKYELGYDDGYKDGSCGAPYFNGSTLPRLRERRDGDQS